MSLKCGRCGGFVCCDVDEGGLIDFSCLSCGRRKTYEEGDEELERLKRRLSAQE